jgi:hypothetical protein
MASRTSAFNGISQLACFSPACTDSAEVVEAVLSQIRQTRAVGASPIAHASCRTIFTFVAADSEDADVTAFVKDSSSSLVSHKKTHAKLLWQPGYHDRILR